MNQEVELDSICEIFDRSSYSCNTMIASDQITQVLSPMDVVVTTNSRNILNKNIDKKDVRSMTTLKKNIDCHLSTMLTSSRSPTRDSSIKISKGANPRRLSFSSLV